MGTAIAATAIALGGSVTASAAPAAPEPLGTPQQLVSANGAIVTSYTITDLKPSYDVIPYQVHGQLWQATASADAVKGTTVPVVSDFNARASTGDIYRAIFNVPLAQGIEPSPLPQGETETGRLYFDVTGPAPDSVVYKSGTENTLTWIT
jgi:hypothetical protein